MNDWKVDVYATYIGSDVAATFEQVMNESSLIDLRLPIDLTPEMAMTLMCNNLNETDSCEKIYMNIGEYVVVGILIDRDVFVSKKLIEFKNNRFS